MSRAGCAGACRAGSREGGPGAGTRCQSPERVGRGGLCSLPAPGKAQFHRTRRGTPCPVLPLRALPAPALARGSSTRGAAPGFGNLIRAVPGAGAALGSPAGAGAAEQVWAQLLHGSAIPSAVRKGPYKLHSEVGIPREAPWCCGRSCLGAGCAGDRREVRVDVGMARGEGRRGSTTPPVTALPWHFHVALSLLCCWMGRTSRKSDLH